MGPQTALDIDWKNPGDPFSLDLATTPGTVEGYSISAVFDGGNDFPRSIELTIKMTHFIGVWFIAQPPQWAYLEVYLSPVDPQDATKATDGLPAAKTYSIRGSPTGIEAFQDFSSCVFCGLATLHDASGLVAESKLILGEAAGLPPLPRRFRICIVGNNATHVASPLNNGDTDNLIFWQGLALTEAPG